MEQWDLVVAGAGPAGAAAALAALRARPGAAVLLLDRADFPRDKVCGDGLAPHAVDVLAGLGVDPTEGYPEVRDLRVDVVGGAEARGRLPARSYVVPRRVLDARLVEAAQSAGARLVRHRVRSVRTTGEGVVVDDRWRAPVVVGADGASSAVARACGVAPSSRLALAVRGYVPATGAAQRLRLVPRRAVPAYAWEFPVGDGSANTGYGEALPPGGLRRAQLADRLAELLPDAVPGELTGHLLPLSSGRARLGPGPVLLAGDAAGLVNPLSGEGIYYAVESGRLAGEVAVSGVADPGTAYAARLRARLGPHLRATALAASLAARPGVLRAGVRAAARDERAFADLVELALGRGRLTPRLVGGLLLP
ncbi:geranylgeranyl reductase family protein [Motilibacter rhizosphaerae]|uniref:Geranylgeranyl reductase family protein n=1 Tax=Motilibacter rhizosphaerae TaxID=598652 RepID=A0A4Q7NFT2_9ACTN|nr:geranylgeranyl reductase family protein [Motilibacter rhizosphaerae]RZS82751.1 geranylgeranyl reductase family protein [Motilibacter rhizosphaerae]